MEKQIIKYISYYDTHDSNVKRNYVASAANKLEYIAKTIASLGYLVEIISVSEVREEVFKFYSSEKKLIGEGITLNLPFSWGGNKGLLGKLKILWHLLYLFFYLLRRCNHNDTVIVYHSLGYFDIIKWAKKIKHFQLILEVEEIYSDVSRMSAYWRSLEFKMFNIADAFILSNDLLDTKINKSHKPSLVIYGSYQVDPILVNKHNDGKIHAIYAGTFDPNKGGVQTAIEAVKYLPGNYQIHICGFGNREDVEAVKLMIAEEQNKSRAIISYDGLKKGEEFIRFLQQCHIGLSTQIPIGDYNDTSFPSKVLTYMANGLAVVSIRIPVLDIPPFSEVLSFYNEPSGNALSEAILNCDYQQSSRELVKELNDTFVLNLKNLIDQTLLHSEL